jgi:hypothetical protein
MNGPASITVQATILRIYSRRPNSDGSEWIAAAIGAGGYSSASGVVYEPLRKGDLVEFIGRPTEYKGEPQIRFATARRIDPKLLDGEAAALVKAGVAKSHAVKLRAELGDDFAARLAADPALIEAKAFARWKERTRRKVVDTCKELAAASARLKSLRAVIPDAKRIAKIEAAITEESPIAYGLVRLGLVSLNEADRLANAPGFVAPPDPVEGRFSDRATARAYGALWAFINDRTKSGGHTAHPVSEIRAHLESQHAVNPDVGANAFEAALKAAGEHSVKIVDGGSLALSPLLRAEREIYEAARSAVARKLFTHHRPIGRTSVKLNDTQIAAVSLAIRSPISFIAGGPGTGKTTICEAIAGALGSQNVLGAALANRAANNLGARARIETINVAKLLHTKALVEWAETSNVEALIIDESSMIGSRDFARIIDKARECGVKRLIFVGDEAQLPPIEAGSPFADIVLKGKAPVARLDRVYRFAEGGGVALLCRDVRRGGPFEDFTPANYPGVSFLSGATGDTRSRSSAGAALFDPTAKAVNLAISAYARLIEGGADPLEIAIIAPFKTRGDEAVRELNTRVRHTLGRSDPVGPGEMVIIASNDLGGVSNGVRGIVSKIAAKDDKPHVFIDFEEALGRMTKGHARRDRLRICAHSS